MVLSNIVISISPRVRPKASMALFSTIQSTWLDWSGETGIAAAGKISHSKGKLRQFVWLVIFVSGLGLTVNTTLQLITNYRKYEVDTVITLKQQASVSPLN